MRWSEVVEIIHREPGVTPEQLSSHFGVSDRRVRSFIREANDRLTPHAEIKKQRGGGYTLHVVHQDACEAIRNGGDAERRRGHAIPETHRERVAYLLNDLVMRAEWVLLDDLAETCACSRSTLSLAIRDVESVLSRFDLTLERRPRYGMRVNGSELNRRLCIAACAMGDLEPTDPASVSSPEPSPLPEVDTWLRDLGVHRETLEAIASSVEEALSTGNVHINALSYQNLLVHIAVALVRIEAGCYVPLDAEELAGVEGSNEYAAAKRVAAGILGRLGVELPEEEVAYIAMHLAGKRTMYDSSEVDGLEGNLVISDEIWDVVVKMLESVRTRFHFDFLDDLELRMNLARHLVPLSVRLRSQMELKNPLLADITKRYPLAWSMSVGVADILTSAFGSEPSNDEMGYIALAFALALERQRGKAPKKRLLVVCASGAGSARLLEYRCQKEFGAYVDSIATCDVMHIKDVDFSDIDYVFTTVPIQVKLPVPVREVSFFFDTAEAEGMRSLLRSGAREEVAASNFCRELFFPHLALTSKDEVLRFLCAAAREVCGGCEDLERFVFEREAAAATSFGNNVAMPHPLQAVSDATFVVVGLLDKPVRWDEAGTEVRAVFLVCFSRQGGSELDSFISVLADFFTDERAIGRLLASQEWETLSELIGLTDRH